MKRFPGNSTDSDIDDHACRGSGSRIYLIPQVQTVKRAGGSEGMVSGQRG